MLKNNSIALGVIVSAVSLSTLGVGVSNANLAETITIVGIYVHAWFLSFALALPFIVLTYEALAIRKKDPEYMKAAIRASRVWGISFAAGAVTGTLVEFGLVQIWSGSLIVIGTAFFAPLVIELFAFMAEIVFLAIYMFTWDIFKYRWTHWIFGIGIGIGSIWSAYQILTVNAWMNVPWGTGNLVSQVLPWEPSLGPSAVNQPVIIQIFHLLPSTGSAVVGNLGTIQSLGTLITNPLISFMNPEALPLFLHTVTAAVIIIGFSVSAYIAFRYFRNRENKASYLKLFKIPFGVAAIASILQPFFGDLEGRIEYVYMYTKFLAVEGIPAAGGQNPVLGLLLYGNPSHFFAGFDALKTQVSSSIAPGLASYTISFAQQNQYWLTPTYYSMIISGVILFIFSIAYFGLFSKFIDRIVRTILRKPSSDIVFYAATFLPAFAIIASIAGWAIREVGRHPWSILGLITYNEIVTPVNLSLSYIYLIMFIEIAVFVGGTAAILISLTWKVKEKTISTEPDAEMGGGK